MKWIINSAFVVACCSSSEMCGRFSVFFVQQHFREHSRARSSITIKMPKGWSLRSKLKSIRNSSKSASGDYSYRSGMGSSSQGYHTYGSNHYSYSQPTASNQSENDQNKNTNSSSSIESNDGPSSCTAGSSHSYSSN